MTNTIPKEATALLENMSRKELLGFIAGLLEGNAKETRKADSGTLEDLAIYGAAIGYEASAKIIRQIAEEMK